MLLPGENSPKSWLFVTILVSTIIAFSESSEGKRLDFKLGFDLTQAGIGGPSLRIRDFEDSREYNPRALAGESSNDESTSDEKKIAKPSSEEQPRPKKEESSKEHVKADKSEDEVDDEEKNSASGDDNTVRVTRGPQGGEFDPEDDNPKIHAKFGKNSDSEKNSDEDVRRYKRHIDRFGNVVKRK